MGLVVVDGDHLARQTLLQHHGAPAGLHMLAHQWMTGVHGDVAEVRGLGMPGHLQAKLVIGVQHRVVAGNLDDDALDGGHVLQRIDPLEAEVVGGDVQHRADIATLVPHATPQQPTARGFQHGGVNGWIAQHHLGRSRPGQIALHAEITIDIDPVGRRHPDSHAAHLEDRGYATPFAPSWSCRWCR
jgi:hypothetical protein